MKRVGFSIPYISTGKNGHQAHFSREGKMHQEKGRKLPGPVTLDKLISLMNLHSEQAKYFRALVGYNLAATYDEREYRFEQMVTLNHTPKKMVEKDAYAFYHNWYHTTIRAFLDASDFKNEYKKTEDALFNRVTPKQVESSISLLSKLGLIKKTTQGIGNRRKRLSVPVN